MMEIPKGKWCPTGEKQCFSTTDGIGRYCTLFNSYFLLYKNNKRGRCPECLSAYPNGAVITITPKEVPCK